MLYLICYDISNPKRLQRVAKALEDFGLRIQKSFFQCEMSQEMLDKLVKRVLKEIYVSEDRFFIYPMCESCSNKAIKDGTGELIKLDTFEIL